MKQITLTDEQYTALYELFVKGLLADSEEVQDAISIALGHDENTEDEVIQDQYTEERIAFEHSLVDAIDNARTVA